LQMALDVQVVMCAYLHDPKHARTPFGQWE